MRDNVDITIFEQPSGNVLGIGHVSATIASKPRVVAKCLFFSDRDPEILLQDQPRKLSFKDVRAIVQSLDDFSKAIALADEGRRNRSKPGASSDLAGTVVASPEAPRTGPVEIPGYNPDEIFPFPDEEDPPIPSPQRSY